MTFTLSTLSKEDLHALKTFIRNHTGLDYFSRDEQPFIQLIERFIQYKQLNDLNGFYAFINAHPDAIRELIPELTNNETYFFREAIHFQLLTDSLLPELLAAKKDKIKITSIGCSSGTELYSIAISLREKFGSSWHELFELYGLDIDDKILQRAREGHYHSNDFRSINANLEKKYFSESFNKDGRQTFVIDKEFRENSRFLSANICQSPLPIPKQNIIFYRNVSIYFDEEMRKQVITNLHLQLEDNGFLITGLTESYSNDFKILLQKQKNGVFYFQKADNEPLLQATTQISPFKTHLPLAAIKKPDLISRLNKEPVRQSFKHAEKSKQQNDLSIIEKQIKDKDYDNALMLLNDVITNGNANLKHYLYAAFIYYNRQQFDQALSFASKAYEQDEFLTDTLLLLGLISKWKEQTPQAINWFKKVVFSQPSCWTAHFYLATLLQKNYHLPAALKEYQLTLKQLQNTLGSDFLIPIHLPQSQVKILCLKAIQDLSQHGKKRNVS